MQQLQSEVESQAEKISQLLVEKEKAVADLIAIRKINRTIEKYVNFEVFSTSYNNTLGISRLFLSRPKWLVSLCHAYSLFNGHVK